MPQVADDTPIFQNPPMSSKRTAEQVVNGDGEANGGQKPQQVQQPDNSQAIEIAKAQVMAQLATDPEISKILQARQTGKKVSIIDPDEAADAANNRQEEVDWNNLDNKQLVEKLPNLLGPIVESTIKKYMEPVAQQVGQLQNGAQQQQAQQINNSIAAAKAKFGDFEDYRKSMVQLNSQLNKDGAMSVEDLYYLAKARAGDFSDKVIEPTSTARPSQVAARPSLASQRKQPLPAGKRGMTQLLDEALNRNDFNSLSDALEE